MVIADRDGKIQMVNAQTERIFGYKRDEILGREVEILIPERFHSNHTKHRLVILNTLPHGVWGDWNGIIWKAERRK